MGGDGRVPGGMPGRAGGGGGNVLVPRVAALYHSRMHTMPDTLELDVQADQSPSETACTATSVAAYDGFWTASVAVEEVVEAAWNGDNPINGLDPSGEMRIIFAFEGLGNYDKNRTVKDGGNAKTINQFLIDAGIDPNPSSVPVTDDSKDDYVIYSNYNGFQNALNWITKQGLDKPYKTASGGCKYNTFVAVGHSLGGCGAWAFSHKVLEQLHFKVNLGFTLDTRDAFNPPTDNEGPNAPWNRADWGWNTLAAGSWINYYRPTGWLQGYPLPGGVDNRQVTDGTTHDGLLTKDYIVNAFRTAVAAVGFSQDKLPQ